MGAFLLLKLCKQLLLFIDNMLLLCYNKSITREKTLKNRKVLKMEELKNCPFCGGNRKDVTIVTFKNTEVLTMEVSCKCGAYVEARADVLDEPSESALKEYVIEKWNRRG